MRNVRVSQIDARHPLKFDFERHAKKNMPRVNSALGMGVISALVPISMA